MQEQHKECRPSFTLISAILDLKCPMNSSEIRLIRPPWQMAHSLTSNSLTVPSSGIAVMCVHLHYKRPTVEPGEAINLLQWGPLPRTQASGSTVPSPNRRRPSRRSLCECCHGPWHLKRTTHPVKMLWVSFWTAAHRNATAGILILIHSLLVDCVPTLTLFSVL